MLKNNGAHPAKETERRMDFLCREFRTPRAATQAFALRAPLPISTRPVGNLQQPHTLPRIATTGNDCAAS